MMKYILIETKGRVFDNLVRYVHYHSLSDLLIELMQFNVVKDTLKVQSKLALEDDWSEDDVENSTD